MLSLSVPHSIQASSSRRFLWLQYNVARCPATRLLLPPIPDTCLIAPGLSTRMQRGPDYSKFPGESVQEPAYQVANLQPARKSPMPSRIVPSLPLYHPLFDQDRDRKS